MSVVESWSSDGTRDLLRKLDARLADAGVARRIVLDDKRLVRPSKKEMETSARIEYLAAVRNFALEPLVEQGGFARVRLDRDLDVYVDTLDAREVPPTPGTERRVAANMRVRPSADGVDLVIGGLKLLQGVQRIPLRALQVRLGGGDRAPGA